MSYRENEHVMQMTMAEAVEFAKFNGNCYCLTTLREVDITDLEDIRGVSPSSKASSTARPLTDRERVAKDQKDRARFYKFAARKTDK